MSDLHDYWPKAVQHLREPYDNRISDHVVVAEINEAPQNGYKGLRLVRTALVPLEVVDEVLSAPGGIGYEVRSWGPVPCVGEGQVYETSFWIDGRKGKNERFQTIINSWSYHDREVILPDNVLLMTYGLTPRHLNDGTVCWDDPRGPVYDVLRVKSHVNHGDKKDNPLGLITIRREYLEDFCHLKNCAAVAVYYEERFSSEDDSFVAVLKGQEGDQFELPGRLLGMAVLNDKYHSLAPQMSRVWGARLILIPRSRPVTDATDPELTWPDDTEPMNYQRAAAKWVYGHIRDEVLLEYEAHPEYRIHPESGGVSYSGWWGTARTYRVGRNHIRIELKQLYEGCPPHVISHWHRYSVQESVAEHDRVTHGNRNIAIRAKDVLDAYLTLTANLAYLSDQIGMNYTQDDIGVLSTEEVAYRGWWSFEVMRPLFAVAPIAASREQFLDRAVSLFKLLELLKPAPLRAMARQLGVPKEQIKEFASLKLLACVCQLATISLGQGLALTEDADVVVPQWNPKTELPELRTLFALNGLRSSQAHTPGAEREAKISSGAAVFGIDVTATTTGWGYAIDALYDRLTDSLLASARLIEDALAA
ncbi:hypothetical protein [Thauera chlorobenzoica]|uniref:Uncharacterized protein n=1 Tax=Thauera chlorobenzoica TaxID=96773 RepID=A0A1H5WGT0_9RHOO|nr:hypothetical protein [Thauera chlorobenzoica]APR03161.1 hypothetical protein Tchl_0288 [Thauera chlorobenzoica]SEF98027.1 hypothetical protein SAMN05216242_11199 [Thauera chlorobenzoica]